MNKIRTFCHAHPKAVRAVLLGVFLLLCILFGVRMATLRREAAETDKIYDLVPPDFYTLEGLSREGNVYTPTGGAARILVPAFEQEVAQVLLYFGEPVEGAVHATISLSPGEGEPAFSYQAELYGGGQSIEISVKPMWAESISVSLGVDENATFTLDGIFVREQRTDEQALYAMGETALAFAAILLLGTAAFLLLRRVRLHTLLLVLGLSLGICYMLVITPLAPPDEQVHYQRSYELSSKMLGRPDEALDIHYDYTSYLSHFNSAKGHFRLLQEAFRAPETAPQAVDVRRSGLPAYALPYLPGAIGISLARLAGCNFIGVFYIGRLCNLLLYIGLAYFALRRLPRMKILFFLAAILPMALHQAISFSTDAFINGMSLLLLANMMSAIYGEGRLTARDYLGMLLPAMLLAPAKVVYAALALPVLLVPRERFGSRRRYWLQALGLLGGGAAVVLCFNLLSIRSLSTGIASSYQEGVQNYTLSYLLKYPGLALQIFFRTLSENGLSWISQTVGRILAGLTLPLPAWYSIALWVLLLLAAFPAAGGNGWIPSLPQKLVFALVTAAVVGLTMLSMFLGWTSDQSPVILGVQGRYFLPVVIPFCLLFRSRFLAWKHKPVGILLLLGIFMNCLTLLSVLQYTMGA